MKVFALLAALLCGCSFDPNGIALFDGGGGPDGARADANVGPDAQVIDAGPPDAPACVPTCTDATHIDNCSGGAPVECALGCLEIDAAGDRCKVLDPSNGVSIGQLAGATAQVSIAENDLIVVNTDTGEILRGGSIVRAAGPNVIAGIGFYEVGTQGIFAVASLTVAGKGRLVGTGTNSLAILSAGDVLVNGTIDVSAGCRGHDGTPTDDLSCGGPGGGDGATSQPTIASGCAPGSDGTSMNGPGPETGGGGGGFLTNGAPGGNAAPPPTSGGAGGVTGSACSPESLVPIRGGSGGGQGGGEGALFGGQGGGGGGAIQITSLTQIQIVKQDGDTGAVLAAGGGGSGGGASFGGGGGGSGGAILLEAPRVVVTGGVVAANGGAGGQGNGVNEGASGTATKEAAKGGGGNADGHGGNGGALNAPGGAPTAGFGNLIGTFDGTGGGGASAGRIRINARQAPTSGPFVISPAPSLADVTAS